MSETHHVKLLIVGSGPAGYTAAIYGARAMLDPMVIQGIQPGGQLTITTDVENWPGDASVLGPDLMQRMEHHAREMGATVVSDHVNEIDLRAVPKVARLDSGATVTADAVILATGAQAKWLGLPSEEEFKGFGVSACATCDGFFYRGREVVVIGGGNTAVEEALYLTNHSDDVTLIHRRDELRAEKILQERLLNHPKISVLWNKTVESFEGDPLGAGLTHLALKDTQDGSLSDLAVDGAFVAIGHAPSTELFKGKLPMDEGGYLLVEAGTPKTEVPGVFAAGDVTDHVYRQAVTAAGMGCMAALDAERFLAGFEIDQDGDAHEVAEAAE